MHLLYLHLKGYFSLDIKFYIYLVFCLAHNFNNVISLSSACIVFDEKPAVNIVQYHLYVESQKWYTETYLQSRNRVTHVENKLMVTGGREEMGKTGS